jgi:hypothetical protein
MVRLASGSRDDLNSCDDLHSPTNVEPHASCADGVTTIFADCGSVVFLFCAWARRAGAYH